MTPHSASTVPKFRSASTRMRSLSAYSFHVVQLTRGAVAEGKA